MFAPETDDNYQTHFLLEKVVMCWAGKDDTHYVKLDGDKEGDDFKVPIDVYNECVRSIEYRDMRFIRLMDQCVEE